MNNLAGATQANGYLGAFLRSQGYLGIIIQGKADGLKRIHIDENGVRSRTRRSTRACRSGSSKTRSAPRRA